MSGYSIVKSLYEKIKEKEGEALRNVVLAKEIVVATRMSSEERMHWLGRKEGYWDALHDIRVMLEYILQKERGDE